MENGELIKQRIQTIDLQVLDLINEREKLVLKYTGNIQMKQASIKTISLSDFYKKTNDNLNNPKNESNNLLAIRKNNQLDTVIKIRGTAIGNGIPSIIAGPCSVESYEQMRKVAEIVRKNGLKLIRGGAYKPRTSPYEFQGLGLEGLKILKRIREEFDLIVISEIVNPSDIEFATEYIDVIQIGARNMQNFELLKAAGRVSTPILLKRGLSATIQEFIYAAEYILLGGNPNVILCERGIRTYEKATRNTLDISAVAILKKETHLPVLVDVAHSTGQRDLVLPMSKASLACGADGVMLEVHPDPETALSDAKQQLSIPEFLNFLRELKGADYIPKIRRTN